MGHLFCAKGGTVLGIEELKWESSLQLCPVACKPVPMPMALPATPGWTPGDGKIPLHSLRSSSFHRTCSSRTGHQPHSLNYCAFSIFLPQDPLSTCTWFNYFLPPVFPSLLDFHLLETRIPAQLTCVSFSTPRADSQFIVVGRSIPVKKIPVAFL